MVPSSYRYVQDSEGNWQRVTNDEAGRVFQGLVVTPRKATVRHIPETIDNSLEGIKQRENFFKYRDSNGNLRGEPGLNIVSPEFEIISGVRGLQGMLSKSELPSLGKPSVSSKFEFPQPILQKPKRYIPSFDDMVDPKDLQLGKLFDDTGGESVVYLSKNNPGYLTKLKSEIYEAPTLDDLEFVVNRDLSMNRLPGVEPISYKGFTYQANPTKTLNPRTGKVVVKQNDQFVPIYEQKKLLPSHRVNTDAFDVDQEFVINDWLANHGYTYNPKTTFYRANGIDISDYGFNNFAFDDFGNMKLIDPMIQKFGWSKMK